MTARWIARSALAILGLAPLAMGLGATPAQAQFFAYGYNERFYIRPEIGPVDVVEIVYDAGFRRPSRPVYQGDVYLIDATDEDGSRVRLTVDSYSGFIIRTVMLSRPVPGPRPPVAERRNRLDDEASIQRVPGSGPVLRDTPPRRQAPTRTVPDDEAIEGLNPRTTPAPRPAPAQRPRAERPPVERPIETPRRRIEPRQVEPRQTPPAGTATAPSTAPAPSTSGVGSGTREAPRRIDIVPPAQLDDVVPRSGGGATAPVPPATLD